MKEFDALYNTIKTLRAPGGCDWDREQTPLSLRGDLIEETYECLEAIDENDPTHIAEELGDLYLLVTMLSYMHEQEGKFSVADVLTKVNEKLIRRHPHVFDNVKVESVKEILGNWSKIKIEQEGRKPKDSIMDEVSSGMPPMDRAYKLQKKAAKVGFDWPDVEGVVAKIREELEEVEEELTQSTQSNAEEEKEFEEKSLRNSATSALNKKIEEELGDVLFSVINLCRFLKIEPSVALNRTNKKFIERFKYVEQRMKESNKEMNKENMSLMDGFWNQSKNNPCKSV